MPANRSMLLLVALVSLLLSGCGVSQTSVELATAIPTPHAPDILPPPITPAPTAAPVPTAAPTAPPAAASFNTPFQLKVNETTSLPPDLAITFKGATNDSRCPSNVACVWAGEVDLIIEVAVAGNAPTSLKLNLQGQNQTNAASVAQVHNYTVRAVKLDPYPGALPSANAATPSPTTDYAIPGGEYVATLIVEQTAAPTATVAFQRVAIGATEGFIVPAASAGGIDARATSYWTPAEADVRAMEAQLAGYLATAAVKRSPQLAEKQTTYKRQYYGLVVADRKLISTNFFCNVDSSMAIDHQTIFVMDGGDCYFQTTYDVEQHTFTNLQINGNA